MTVGTDSAGVIDWVAHPAGRFFDHEPVPVRSDAAPDAETLVCDICTSHDIAWVFPTRGEGGLLRFGDGPAMKFDDDTRWITCGPCADLIDRRDLRRLADRAVEAEPFRMLILDFPVEQREEAIRLYRRMIAEQHRQFLATITGDRKALKK